MRNLCLLCFLAFTFSCTPDQIDQPEPPPAPLLKLTIQTDVNGAVMRVVHFNDQELPVFDTTYFTGTQNPGMIYVNTYNSAGKRTKMDNTIVPLYTAGPYWTYIDEYQADTLPVVYYRYLRGVRVAEVRHIYNSAKQLVQDSTYHTPNYGTFTYLTNYTYDGQGRLLSSTDLNDTRDTTKYITYQYFPNRVEKLEKSFNSIPIGIGYGLSATEYNASGEISSEIVYSGMGPAIVSQTDYTYNASGILVNKTIMTTGSATREERYTLHPFGKPQKMELFVDGVLAQTVTYYYE